ncbi:MAG TPA: hypothetical protein VFC63_16880 [Blastocatellia bacterium]|nr:hypothetical protein [Blastocatellia bacterium]
MVKEIQKQGRRDFAEEEIDETLDESYEGREAGHQGPPESFQLDPNTQTGHSGSRQEKNRTRRNPKNG